MERISIFNYEAFYLDYLEGNLSEEDTSMLLQFLEEHPECRLEDEDLVLLDDEGPMTFNGKQSLKQVDEEGPIALNNVEHFMIAEAEGLLTEEKVAELNTLVANDTELEATRRRYNAVYYTPDTSVVYGAKSELKQRRVLALWPYMSGAVAAAAVVAIVLLTSTYDALDVNTTMQNTATAGVVSGQDNNEKQPEKKDDPIQRIINETKSFSSSSAVASNAGTTVKEKPVIRLNPMDRRNMQIAPASINGDVSSRPNLSEPIDWTAPDNFEDKKGFGPDLENPIEPITAFIAEKAKTEVDFKRRKATEDKKGGFLVKIGKFELSRNKN